MAHLEELIARIKDEDLRRDIEAEVGDVKNQVKWGLVFERHLPESARLLVAPIKVGSVVWDRKSATPRRMRVRSIEGSDLVVVLEPKNTTAPADAETFRLDRSEVLIEKDFVEPVFPTLTPIGAVRNAPADRPSHAVIQGENYHAIATLLTAYEGQADCLYLDPPYNTGDKDWAYNNDYVDPTDAWRSSKWLSFMERRLRLAQRLLKPDGVMVVTIDENEVHHLGMLLEQMFPAARVQMVTIAIHPSGSAGDGFSRVDEYAYFVFFGGRQPNPTFEDFFGPEGTSRASWWHPFIRSGNSWVRASRPNLCYPVKIDKNGRIAGAGEPLTGPDDERPLVDGEFSLAWPIRTDGRLSIWSLSAERVRDMTPKGYLVATKPSRGTWSIRYLLESALKAIESGEIAVEGYDEYGGVIVPAKQGRVVAKTMWHRNRHTAGRAGGSQLLNAFGLRGAFSYPKSVYAVRDTLDTVVGDNPDALIMDFFGGSGTTLHATMLLNAETDKQGRRRCVLVTNNEVNAATAAALNARGVFRGDPTFEAAGVFESATRPRINAVITGRRPDGAPAEGTYKEDPVIPEREFAEGFEENVEFFRLDYVDPVAVELGMHFDELHPLMWLAAGGIGERAEIDQDAAFALPAGSPYAVLFDPSGVPGLLTALADRDDVTHIFIIADSDVSFSSLAPSFAAYPTVIPMYRSYLETLRGATS